ncbi:MAG: NUDIX hydrolase [Rhodospirillales bacterium]|nr:MAG: NUDIX hydrolase [Rhodospirillales bacterium]
MADTPDRQRFPWAPDANFRRRVPDGDTHERLICDDCGYIAFENPKIVVGSVALWEDRILLAKRAIHPRKGYWTLPAGFMEMKESTEQGAAREAMEEACARIEIDALLAMYSIPRIGQVQIMYRARLLSPDVAPGEESTEVGLFRWEEIPWNELAFPTVTWALRDWHASRALTVFAPYSTPVDYPGAAPR